MEINRVYTVPLKKAWVGKSRSRRAKKAMSFLREFLKKSTKSKEVKISSRVSDYIHSHGFKKPPGKIKVIVSGNENSVSVDIFEESVQSTLETEKREGKDEGSKG